MSLSLQKLARIEVPGLKVVSMWGGTWEAHGLRVLHVNNSLSGSGGLSKGSSARCAI